MKRRFKVPVVDFHLYSKHVEARAVIGMKSEGHTKCCCPCFTNHLILHVKDSNQHSRFEAAYKCPPTDKTNRRRSYRCGHCRYRCRNRCHRYSCCSFYCRCRCGSYSYSHAQIRRGTFAAVALAAPLAALQSVTRRLNDAAKHTHKVCCNVPQRPQLRLGGAACHDRNCGWGVRG
jgi:hypothetical protein